MGYANPDAVTQIANGLSTTTFTYDNNGNVTQKTTDGTTTTYVYDYANRLTALGAGGATTSVDKVFVVGGSQRARQLGLRTYKSLQSIVERPIGCYVLVVRDLVRSVPRYQLPPFVVEGADLLGDLCELLRGSPVVDFGAGLDAAAKFCGIEHGLPDHLEDLALKNMGGDLRVPAAYDLRPVVVVLSRAAVAAVRGVMIHGHSSRGTHDLLPSSEGRTPTSAHAALHEATQKVVRGRLAIARVVLSQQLLHLVE
jgi:hypothetical protein